MINIEVLVNAMHSGRSSYMRNLFQNTFKSQR